MLHLPDIDLDQIERLSMRLALLIMMLAELAEIVHKSLHNLLCVPLGWR